MEEIRRTIPRSARRMPKRESLSIPTPQKSAERYVPQFQRTQPATTVTRARTGLSSLSPNVNPILAFCPAPLTRVRWVPVREKDALAVVGSGDGEHDFLSFFAVSADPEIVVREAREMHHEGKVRGIAISQNTDIMYVGSSNGRVRRLPYAQWEQEEMSDVMDVSEETNRKEGVAGVAAISGMVVAAGDHGSLCGANAETGAAWARQFDEVAFRDIVAVDENGSEVITAGCDVAIWDVRTGKRCELVHPTNAVATSVAGDERMPQFIMAGTRDGEVSVWDRRAEKQPLSRIALHDGPVWDVRVVNSRSGVLTCCGEDGMVWLVDFAKAALRGGLGSAEQIWCERGEFWRAAVEQSDVRQIVGSDSVLAINSVDVHGSADLFAYVSDSGSAGFGRLYGEGLSSDS